MSTILSKYFDEERNQILEKCIACGDCISECPIIKHTDLKQLNPIDVQIKVLEFLEKGTESDEVYTKSFACMECYKCVKNNCPQGLNPLLINEIIKWDYNQKSLKPIPYTDPKNENAKQRVLSSIQISSDEYKKIFTSSTKDTGVSI